MTTKQEKALQCYDSNEQERMTKVIEAINSGRLIYVRFLMDCSGVNFYCRDNNDMSVNPSYFLYCFDTKQANVILMGSCIDITTFGI